MLSWIWLRHNTQLPMDTLVDSEEQNEDAESFQDGMLHALFSLSYSYMLIGMRVEWAKSLACAERWEEEQLLVQEEMQCVLLFLQKKAIWWVDSSKNHHHRGHEYLSGIRAYASKQSNILNNLAHNFADEWLQIRRDCNLPTPSDWPQEFLCPRLNNMHIRRRPHRRKLQRRIHTMNVSPSAPEAGPSQLEN